MDTHTSCDLKETGLKLRAHIDILDKKQKNIPFHKKENTSHYYFISLDIFLHNTKILIKIIKNNYPPISL